VIRLEEVASSVTECLGELVRPGDLEWRAGQRSERGVEPPEFLIRGKPGIVGGLHEDGSGLRAFELLTALRSGGFGASGPYRVPEPVGSCADRRLLLARMPPGCTESLDELLDRDPDAAARGVREAAHWLLVLHESPLRIGASDHPWGLLGELTEELAAVAATCPGEAGRLNDLLERLSAIEDTTRPEEVQIHGRFRPSQVFPRESGACVAGLDLSQPSDPARDLAEFVLQLRTALHDGRGGRERVDSLTAAFLQEYAARRDPSPGRVGFFRAAGSVLSLCRHLRGDDRGTPQSRAAADFHVREFEAAVSTVPGSPSGAVEAGRLPAGEFQSRAAALMDREFVERVVFPAAFGKSQEGQQLLPFEADIPQEDRETGRVTIRYRFAGGATVFGKLYPSHEPLPSQIMRQLWGAGFGEGAYQVAETIAFIPEHRFLLTRAAPGVPLADLLGAQGPEVIESLRRAARWLVKLHTSPLRLGPPETPSGSMRLLTIVRRFLGAAAAVPGSRERLREMLRALCRKGAETAAPAALVQTHGSFHHEHVYLSADTVTVIDFDKSRPADPARDLAEFLTMFRRKTFSKTGDPVLADAPTRAFLEEYAGHLPGHARSLPVYWGAAILFDLLRYRKRAVRDEALGRMVAFLEQDYDAVLSGAFG